MASRVVLHIGTMKSGTSFIQNVLGENKQHLRDEQGILFPGKRWRQQVSAVFDLIERGGARQEPMADDGPWRTLAGEVNAWDGDAIISMEFLGPRQKEKINQIQDSFGAVDLEVVITARDLARSIPAMWQESVQNAATTTWPEFLEAVEAERDEPGPGRWFWNHQGVAAMSQRWAKAVGRDHFTLITVPPPGAAPTLLWDRFTQVAGIDPTGCTLDVRSNPSIGVASALVMRQLNEALDDAPLNRAQYHRYVKHPLAKAALASRKKDEPVLGLDAPWVHPRGADEVERLRKLDLRVVGNLDELLPQPVKGVHTDDVGSDEQLEAAVAALAAAVRGWIEPSGRKGRNKGKGRGKGNRGGGRGGGRDGDQGSGS
jgi:hypothetical protein